MAYSENGQPMKARKRRDYTGERLGWLTVIRQLPSDMHGNHAWECKCDCGKTVVRASSTIRNGRTTSCGCKKGVKQRRPDSAFNELFLSYRKSASHKHHVFSLTAGEFRKLTQERCFYCGTLPSKSFKTRNHERGGYGEPYTYNGIDRYNNSLGYLLSNCVACCATCNYLKRDRDGDEFLELIQRIVNWQKSNQEQAA